MIDASAALRWIVCLACGLSGAWYLVGYGVDLARGHASWRAAVAATAHLAMCAVMISMFFSWGARIPVSVQIAVFAVAAAWFLALAIPGRVGGGTAVGCGGPNLYHAGMMAAMVWMAVAMDSMMGTSGSVAAATDTSMTGMSMGGASMSGMSMGGMSMGGMSMGGAASGAPAAWVAAGCLLAGVAFLGAGTWLSVSTIHDLVHPAQAHRRPGTRETAGAGVGVTMAFAMAVTLLVMA